MEKSCSHCGETKKRTIKGLCERCYKRRQRHGDPSISLVNRSGPPGSPCSECDEPVVALGYCRKHWRAWHQHGDPNFVARPSRAGANCTDCGEPLNPGGAKGLCRKCYQRKRKYGGTSDAVLQRHPKGPTCTNCGDPASRGSARGYCDRCYKRWQVHGDPNIVLPHSLPPVNRTHTLNHEYFDKIDTPEQAYWLGFITADGCVIRNSKSYVLSLALAEKDAEHVHLFARALGSSKVPQSYVKPGGKKCVYVYLDSRQLVESLERVGVGPRKSATVEPWDGPADLMPHYWRGLFDGDGCIHRHTKKVGWTLMQVGSQACVTGFTRWAADICGTRTTARHVVGGCWQMAVGGSWMPQKLAAALYQDSPVALPRKLALATELIAADFRTKRGKRTLPRYG